MGPMKILVLIGIGLLMTVSEMTASPVHFVPKSTPGGSANPIGSAQVQVGPTKQALSEPSRPMIGLPRKG
jgi:hypothetical protein